MAVTPIATPLPGEHVIALHPKPGEVAARKRPRLFAGRALTKEVLDAEQDTRSTRLSLLGGATTWGVVDGLGIALDQNGSLRVGAGHGITFDGQDVSLPVDGTALIPEMPVYELTSGESAPDLLVGGTWPVSTLNTGRFEALRNDEFPHVAIVVLAPTAVVVGATDTEGQCDLDPSTAAFVDQQIVDGALIALFPWPTNWMRLPDLESDTPERWRNRLAYAVYDAERKIGPRRWLPWDEVGIAIGMIGFDQEWNPLFVDRYAVAREGSRPLPRTAIVGNEGTQRLWDARLRQFAEQMLEDGPPADPVQTAATFRYVPPVGVLPPSSVDFESNQDLFFPQMYRVQATPVPDTQVDALIARSASLAAYDLTEPDQVQVLVPVSQASYEPRLLVQEAIAPEFDTAVQEGTDRRTVAAMKREYLGRVWRVLQGAATGQEVTVPTLGGAIFGEIVDPERPPDEDPVTLPFGTTTAGAHRSVLAAGPHQHGFEGADLPVPADATELFVWVYLDPAAPPSEVMVQWRIGTGDSDASGLWDHRAFWGADLIDFDDQVGTPARYRVGDLPPAGQWVRLAVAPGAVEVAGQRVSGMAFNLFDGRAVWGPAGVTARGGNPTVWVTHDVSNGSIDRPGGDTASMDVGAGEIGIRYVAKGDNEPWDPVTGDRVMAPLEDDLLAAVRGDRFDLVRANGDLLAAGDGWRFPNLRAEITRLAVLKAADSDFAVLDEEGLAAFIARLEANAKAADDTIDFGFFHVQTNVFRLKRYMLDETDNTRLATSAVLAPVVEVAGSAVGEADLSAFAGRVATVEETAQDRDALLTTWRTINADTGEIVEFKPSKELKDREAQWTDDVTLGGMYEGTLTSRLSPEFVQPVTEFDLHGLTTERNAFVNPVLTDERFVIQPRDTTLDVRVSDVLSPRADFFATDLTVPTSLSAETAATAAAAADADVAAIVGTGALAAQPGLDSGAVPGFTAATRTMSLGTRLAEPAATEGLSYSMATKADLLVKVADLPINLEAVKVVTVDSPPTPTPENPTVYVDWNDAAAVKVEAGKVLGFTGPVDGDEGAFFSATVARLEQSVKLLRGVEAQVARYRTAIQLCREVLAEVTARITKAASRHAIAATELAEARHDVTVARALRHEEEVRIKALNERRRQIIQDVRFLVYLRPRAVGASVAMPLRPLDPVTAAPLPLCQSMERRAPAEVLRMVDTVREAPLGWLTAGAAMLDALDGRDALGALLDQTLMRANLVSQAFARQSPPVAQTNPIDWIVSLHGQSVAQRRAPLIGANLNQLVLGAWSDGRAGAGAIATLGDAMDATRAGRVAGMAAAELESIGRVAACLWAGFGRTPTGVRLAWARLLSQFDTPVNLRVLARLPRWGEVDRLLANELQALTDGLFGRFVTSVPNAVTLANDLVRVCVLVAARAPVDRVVAGSIDRARQVRVGSRVPVTFPPLGDVRIGSFVWFRAQEVEPIEPPQIVGRVVDLIGSTHLVEIEQLQPFGGDPIENPEVTLAATMRAEVISPALVTMNGRI